jgi:predicted metal-dependent phosphoesterase TrpH
MPKPQSGHSPARGRTPDAISFHTGGVPADTPAAPIRARAGPDARQTDGIGPRWRVDLHAHTSASRDGFTAPDALVRRAVRAGLHRIAVTDHGEIRGALRAREAADGERVIVGEEIGCACGTEVLGIFLSERVPMGLPIEEAAARVRAQGGIVYAPHPYAYRTRAAWHAERVLAHADVVEVFNSRAFLPVWNRRAARTAAERGLCTAAGSDAHFPWEIGRAWTELASFDDAAGLLRSLPAAVPVGRRTATPLVHVLSLSLQKARRFSGR